MPDDCRFEHDSKAAPAGSQIHVTVGGPEADIPGLHNCAIQAALDYVAGLGGGTVELTEGEFHISDALYLRKNVVLRGQGDRTVLRKCDAVRSNLRFDADMHESSVTVEDANGFEVGMGVSIGDEARAVQHLVSVRTIIWKAGATLGFNENLETTQMIRNGAFAQITFPVIYGVDVENVAVESLAVDGNSAGNPLIDSWTDGGIYLLRVQRGRVESCRVYDVNADGISLNQSDDILMESCVVHDNARLGIHIGTGSQNAVVTNCRIYANGFAGFSNSDGLNLCFSAQNGLYQGNEIYGNRGAGISIGHKDGDNPLCRQRRSLQWPRRLLPQRYLSDLWQPVQELRYRGQRRRRRRVWLLHRWRRPQHVSRRLPDSRHAAGRGKATAHRRLHWLGPGQRDD